MKKIGAVLVVSGFAIWFGGEFLIPGYNIVGLPILMIGAVPSCELCQWVMLGGTFWVLVVPTVVRQALSELNCQT